MSEAPPVKITVRTLSSLDDIPAGDWNNIANPPGMPRNPFVSHAFLHALEASGSAVPRTGWHARHLLLEDSKGTLLGALICYAKTHSQGEYVFDYGWAEAYERAGGRYYPKLQASVPFTPATGPRFLVPKCTEREKYVKLLADAAVSLTDQLDCSSCHVTFLPEDDWNLISTSNWLRRTDTQFHWHNEGFATFDDFLSCLSSRKRKNIRRERKDLPCSGISFHWIVGNEILEEHLDAFFDFYLETGSRKWGSPYLTRAFFSLAADKLREEMLLVMARRAGRWIAGALNFIGSETLYGRNWGAVEHHEFLHFETCYYQAIEYAIAHGLKTVEAGAQGPHKLARGYLPVETHSLHYLADPRLANAVSEYLRRERAAVKHDQIVLGSYSPFRRED